MCLLSPKHLILLSHSENGLYISYSESVQLQIKQMSTINWLDIVSVAAIVTSVLQILTGS